MRHLGGKCDNSFVPVHIDHLQGLEKRARTIHTPSAPRYLTALGVRGCRLFLFIHTRKWCDRPAN